MQLTRRAVARGRYQAGHFKSRGREPSQEDWVQRVGSYIVRVFRDAIEKLTDHEKTTEKENLFLKVYTRTIATNTLVAHQLTIPVLVLLHWPYSLWHVCFLSI